MEKQCQEDGNFPAEDQVSHNLASSVSHGKTSTHNSSTVSSERGISPDRTFIRSDVSSEIGENLNEKRKNSSTITAEEISQEGSTAIKSDFDFDLNEGMEANEANWHPKSVHESNYSESSDVLSEPIPVVAKRAVPMGFPEKPLQFGGKRGWKRSCITSAFTPTHHNKIRDIKKSRVFRGFDLNLPATVDSEFPVDEGPRKMGLDLNYNPRDETRQVLRNYDAMGTVARPQYWVDLSSVQGQPFQMAVPIQLQYAPPAFYMAYPGNNARLMENSHEMNTNVFANMRQTILSNGSIAFVENGRIKAIEQVGFPVSSMKRRGPDINYRQMASWK